MYIEHRASQKKIPFGYLGHLIRLSNCITHLCSSSDALNGFINEDKEWKKFIDNTLSEFNVLNEGQLDGSGYNPPSSDEED